MSDQPINSVAELEQAKIELAKLTPHDYVAMTNYIKTLEDALDASRLPEAGGIAFTEIVGADGEKINMTARGDTPKIALDRLIEAIGYAKVEYGMEQRTASGSIPVRNVLAADDNYEPESQVQQAPWDTSPSVGVESTNSMIVAKIEVTPLVGDRATIKFFGPGHMYPDLQIINWTVDSLHQKLVNVGGTNIDLTKAFEAPVNWRVTWKEGSISPKSGKPYKNVDTIQPVA